MKNNQSFDKFKSKLTWEAVLNSLLASLSVGFAVGGLIALICWLCGYKNGIWVALGVGAGSAIIAFPLFYFLKFRPTAIKTSRRVDALGLQERAVTMLQYQDDNSEIAIRQREDAKKHVDAASATALAMIVPIWIVIALIVTFVFGTTFGTVSALYRFEVVQSPSGVLDPMDQYVAVSYFVEEGGEIEGEADQILLPGEDAETVTAVAIDGYMFIGWDDGIQSPSRTDLKITEDMEVTAMFEAIGDENQGEEGDFDGPGNKGDSATDQPPSDDASQGGEGDEGDGQGGAGDSEGTGSGDQEGEGKGDGQGEGAGGKWSQSNQIINGEIYYRDWLEQYYQQAMDEISSIEDLPPEIREFIEAYFGSI